MSEYLASLLSALRILFLDHSSFWLRHMRNCAPIVHRYHNWVSCRRILHRQKLETVQHSLNKQLLLSFRFLQTIHAIRLVRGTNPSGSSFVLAPISVFFGLLDRAPEPFSFMRRERSLKKSSAVGSGFGGIVQAERFEQAGIEQLTFEHEGNTPAHTHVRSTGLLIYWSSFGLTARPSTAVVVAHQYR